MDRMDFACEFKFSEPGGDVPAGTVEGYASVFGLLDRGGDIVLAGAFKASLAAWKKKKAAPPMLWQHDPWQPVGVWPEIVEDEKGLKVKGALALDVPKAAEAAALIKAGAVRGLSIGYETLDYEIDRTTGIRRLKKVDLWEVSLVTFPMLSDAAVTGIKNDFDPNLWEKAFRDEGLSNREAKLATSVVRKQVLRDAGRSGPPPRDGVRDVLMEIRKARQALRG